MPMHAGGATTVAYRDDEKLELKPRDKRAQCKRFVIELEARTPSSATSADFLIAASRPGAHATPASPPSAGSRGMSQQPALVYDTSSWLPQDQARTPGHCLRHLPIAEACPDILRHLSRVPGCAGTPEAEPGWSRRMLLFQDSTAATASSPPALSTGSGEACSTAGA